MGFGTFYVLPQFSIQKIEIRLQWKLNGLSTVLLNFSFIFILIQIKRSQERRFEFSSTFHLVCEYNVSFTYLQRPIFDVMTSELSYSEFYSAHIVRSATLYKCFIKLLKIAFFIAIWLANGLCFSQIN